MANYPGYPTSNLPYEEQVRRWVAYHQMSNYPPPLQSDHHHNYNTLYSTTASTTQTPLTAVHEQQLPYNGLAPPMYPNRADGTSPSTPHAAAGHHLQTLARELQHHNAVLDDQHHQQNHQTLHSLQHQTTPTSELDRSPSLQHPQLPASTPDPANKPGNRLRKACDSCSVRKVKCDESGPPCKACVALEIPCTFARPSKRRGPPNRHAEAIKRQRLEGGTEESSPDLANPSPHLNHTTQTLSALAYHSPPLSAESICPIETIDLLIDEFFTYIHPLCPFPHEPSFRHSWQKREDVKNKSFLALLASMIGALVASFPRKPRLHLKAQKIEKFFPNHMSLVDQCQRVCALARGPGYLENNDLGIYDAATSYFLMMMGMYTYRYRQGRLYFGECLTILRTLGLHKPSGQSDPQLIAWPIAADPQNAHPDDPHSRNNNNNHIALEIGRRIFWTMFCSIKAISQLGANFSELVMPPPTPTEPYPPLPAEVDDEYIHHDYIGSQPANVLPIIAGFNANARVYSTCNTLAGMEMAWGLDTAVDWEKQKRVLCEALRQCKAILEALPPQLRVAGDGDDAQSNPAHAWQPQLQSQSQPVRDPAQSLCDPTTRLLYTQTPEEKKLRQYEIQKANIYASSLATRNYLVQKYWNLREAQDRAASQSREAASLLSKEDRDGDAEKEMQEEGEAIIRDLLMVLSSIDHVNIEPNADSVTMKIRSIAATLIDPPGPRKRQVPKQTQEQLATFLKILMKLERVSPARSDADHLPEDEDAELRVWADLREYQRRFAQQGGLLSLS